MARVGFAGQSDRSPYQRKGVTAGHAPLGSSVCIGSATGHIYAREVKLRLIMGTVVALESQDGVVIAGDSQAVTEGDVTSKHVERVFDSDGVGAGAVGDTGDIQEFRRQLENELRSSRIEDGEDVEIDKLARIAARHANSANVDAVVATHDAAGTARLRQVGSEGEVFDSTPITL